MKKALLLLGGLALPGLALAQAISSHVTQLVVNGHYQVTYVVGKHAGFRVVKQPKKAMRWAVRGRTLTLAEPKGFWASLFDRHMPLIKVTVTLPILNRLTLDGPVDFYAKADGMAPLVINSYTSGDVIVNGKAVNLTALNAYRGQVSINGLKSKQVKLMSHGKTFVFMRGQANHLTVMARGNSSVDVSHVKAAHVTVVGYNKARIKVANKRGLNAEGFQHSVIYYGKGRRILQFYASSRLFLASFDHIVVGDDIHVKLVESPREKLMVRKTGALTHVVRTDIAHHTLAISLVPGRHKPVSVTVGVMKLKYLTANDAATVTGQKLHFQQLHVNASGAAKVNLAGKLGVRAIRATDMANVIIHWTQSPHLTVSLSGAATAHVAGVITSLHVRVTGSALLMANQLKVQRVYAQTRDFGTVHVWPIRALHAFAYDGSTIFYRVRPALLAANGYGSGDVVPG